MEAAKGGGDEETVQLKPSGEVRNLGEQAWQGTVSLVGSGKQDAMTPSVPSRACPSLSGPQETPKSPSRAALALVQA